MLETSESVRLNLIYARAANGVIGHNNQLPWHLPEDMAHFKRTTMGCSVIMGRKTWESLPPKFRPLPGRLNIVVTRNPEFVADSASIAGSLQAARDLCPAGSQAWVIGGAQVYAQALPLADRVVVTVIGCDFVGDAFAPTLGQQWREVAREEVISTSGLPLAFVTYMRFA